MTTANHLLAGTILALTIKEPALVLPLAFLSHFLLDALPHYGHDGYGEAFRHKETLIMELLGLIGIAALLSAGVYGWNLALLAAVVAVSPDFEWPFRYFLFERRGKPPFKTPLTRIHKNIQWCERNWAMTVEVGFFVAAYLWLLELQ